MVSFFSLTLQVQWQSNSTCWTEGWMSPRISLDTEVKRNISVINCNCRHPAPSSSQLNNLFQLWTSFLIHLVDHKQSPHPDHIQLEAKGCLVKRTKFMFIVEVFCKTQKQDLLFSEVVNYPLEQKYTAVMRAAYIYAISITSIFKKIVQHVNF